MRALGDLARTARAALHRRVRGRAVTLHGLDVKHFERGRVTREWQYANSAGSLGALFGITFEVP